MQTVEVTAKTVQDGTNQAAEKLGVTADQLKVTVLEETKGLFGKSNVRIRAEVIAAAPAPAPASAPEEAAPVAPKGGRGRKPAAKAPEPEIEAPAPAAVIEAAPAKTTPKSDEGRRPRGRRAEPVAAESNGATEAAEPAAEGAAPVEVAASQKDADILLALVKELLAAADLSITVELGSISGRYVNIILDGKDVAFIVGKHGEVLNAMQYLVNIVASRRIERGVRATLDGNDYRRRREEALTQLAVRIAEQVKKRGEEAVLDALPAFERRIVHKALNEIGGISTYSEGEEPNRRVVIAPAD